ncbi:SDR family oxidoreductase [Bifidobacterium sp.]|uniref:SDR family oxidoreductase n=1 Tax=Bifidobacterium sp. TaxID=41200 RepID=UPI0039E7EB0C
MKVTSSFNIAGRKALVTGSSRGIGFALARGLAKAGADVVIHGRHAQEVERAAQSIRDETQSTVRTATFDITDEHAVADGVDSAIEALGGFDILVNNAGIQIRHPLTEFPAKDWNAVVSVNLTGAFLVAQRAAQTLIEQKSGKIINIASVQSRLARPGITPYSATKGGIVMLTRGLCADLGPSGIQVNALAPGYIQTELTKSLVEDPAFTAWVQGRTPAARWGQVEDLVGTLLFLSSPASDFVNGQTLFVDGGMTAVV